jgi:ABC-type branched-subunit amino acid transport system ATPase component
MAQRAYIINNGHVVYDGTVDALKASREILTRHLGV